MVFSRPAMADERVVQEADQSPRAWHVDCFDAADLSFITHRTTKGHAT